MPESSVTTEFTGKADVLDPHGYPIEMDRPVVFDEGKLEPHTELSSTFRAQELGLPGEGFYNVPTIYGGKIYDPEKDFAVIRQNVQQQAAQGFRFPNFPDLAQAEAAAQARSEYFNQVKAEMLREAVEKRRQELLIQMLKGQANVQQ
jgi:hypothetical protein